MSDESNPITPAYLDHLDALAKGATEGPWCVSRGYLADSEVRRIGVVTQHHPPHSNGVDPYAVATTGPLNHPDSRPDAAFIAESRAALPALVAEVRRLSTLLATAACGKWIVCSCQNADCCEGKGCRRAPGHEGECDGGIDAD